jgi:hypothetical protein
MVKYLDNLQEKGEDIYYYQKPYIEEQTMQWPTEKEQIKHYTEN